MSIRRPNCLSKRPLSVRPCLSRTCVLGEGNWIQITPWWSANSGGTNHNLVWLRVDIEADELILSQRQPWGRISGWSHSCVTDLPQFTFLPNSEGHNSDSSSLLFRQLLCWTAVLYEGWWWRIPLTYTAALGLGEHRGYLALSGRAALLGGLLFCRLFFLWSFSKLLFLFVFPIGSFVVDCLWRYRVKSTSRFW